MEQLFINQNARYLSSLMSHSFGLYYWEADTSLQLIFTNCPEASTIYSFLSLGNCRDYLCQYIEQNIPKLLILSDSTGLFWLASFECNSDNISKVYLLGPAFTSDISSGRLEQEVLKKHSSSSGKQFLSFLRQLPVTPFTTLLHLGQMLSYSVTGEQIEISDINYQSDGDAQDVSRHNQSVKPQSSGTWLSEQLAMQMIEDGRLDYQEAFGHLSRYANLGSSDAEPSRKLKNFVISFTTLATRAAIRGGLDAETAYYIGDFYISNVETASTLSELMNLNTVMYDDFIQRVHKAKTDSSISSAVRACCNYIELHVTETLPLSKLAACAGYTEYYLTRKFKKEMGQSLQHYIKTRKIERAKLMLRSTNQSVQEIGEYLSFCNTSYFIDAFKSIEGMTPGEFRCGTN